jgi:lipopolysaccharide transport system permease protein
MMLYYIYTGVRMESVSLSMPIKLAQTTGDETNRAMAMADVINGYKRYKLWHYLAVTEMRRRYRRTIIGPFWASLSIGIFIACMGMVLSGLWKTDAKAFLPYFSAGYICWMMLSALIMEGCTTFTANEAFLKQLSIPYLIYACLTTWRNFIVFAHHMMIFILVLLYCGHPINFNILFIIPGMLIIFFAAVWTCMLLGMLCARYRDIQQIMNSVLQLTMFVTPIMWKPDQLGAKGQLLTQFNPIYHFISLVRMPLLGEAPPIQTWVLTIVGTIILALITFELFVKKYRTLIYWL